MKSSTLSGLVVAKSAIMSGLVIGLRHVYSELYCNPHCAIRLVAESDPGAFSRHPYWKDLKDDGSCSGAKLDSYVERQGMSSERVIMDTLVSFWTVLGTLLLLRAALQGFRKVASGTLSFSSAASSAIVSCVFGVFSATIFLMHTHFNTDITHLGGGIVHHALSQSMGIDDKRGSVSEGYLIFGMFNRLVYSSALYLLVARSTHLSQYLDPWVLVGLLQVQAYIAVRTVGQNHPVYHEMTKNGPSPAMMVALPYTSEWRAFKHCITHHDDGLSFSGDFFLDPFWDMFLYAFAYLHNVVFRLQLGSWGHHVFSCAGDVAMGAMSIGLIYLLLHVAAWFVVPSTPSPLSAKDKLI